MFTLNSVVGRHCENLLLEMLAESPVVVIEGARQVGKSTLAQKVAAGREAVTVTLDDREVADFAVRDPRGFVEQAPGRLLVIDEAQREPSLILALKSAIDRNREPGRFLITGSADFLRARGASDSLAGRAEILSLGPLSAGEAHSRSVPEDWVAWVLAGVPGNPDGADAEVAREAVIAGGFPVPLARSQWRARNRWYSAYVREIASRDAADLAGGEFSATLPRLLSVIGSSGQSELVRAKLARHLGVSEGTARQYLDLASQMYLVQEVPSWGVGVSGRVVRKPKVSLVDTGLSAHLAGMTPENSRLVGGQEFFGALAEQFVAGELRKQQTWSSEDFQLFHYRHRNDEIDLVVELFDGRLILVEVKSGATVSPRAWSRLERLIDNDRVAARVVLYMGEQVQRRDNNTYLLPLWSLWTHP